MTSKKGQLNSIDMIASTLVFMVLVVFMLSIWFMNVSNSSSMLERTKLQNTALYATDILLKTPGVPTNWEQNSSTVSSLGLVTYNNVLSANKLGNFSALNYTNTKNLLGIDSNVQFYFTLENLSGSVLYSSGNSTLSGNNIVSIVRYATLNNQKTIVRLYVYG